VIVVSIVAEFLAMTAIVYMLHPGYGIRYFAHDLIFGKLSLGIFLGVATGLLFGILANSVWISTADGKSSTKSKALVALLGVLFLMGIGGERLLQEALRRVSKVSVGGAEIAFADPSALRRGRPEGDPSIASAFGDPIARGSAISLEFFKVLPDLINRDRLNIIEAHRIRSLRPDNVQIAGLAEADEMAQIMVAPFGQCLLEIHRLTGDIDFIRTTLAGLLPSLRGLGVKASQDPSVPGRFGEKGAAAFLKLLREILVFTLDHRSALKSLDPENIESACRVLSYTLCAEHDWARKSKNITSLTLARRKGDEAEVRKLLGNALHLGKGPLAACQSNSLPDHRDGFGSTLESDVEAYLTDFARAKDFHQRPYMAMVVAAILTQLGLYDAGLAHLDLWLKNHEADTIEGKWLKIRALNIVIFISDYWIRVDGANASIVLRDFHLTRMGEALALVDDLFQFKLELQRSRHRMSIDDFTKAAFSRPPPESTDCTNKNILSADPAAAGGLKVLYAWFVITIGQSAHHRLLHPEYAKHHAHVTNEFVSDLLLTDLACGQFPPDYKPSFRAWTLRLFASMQLQDVNALKSTLGRAALEARLENGMRAADLGVLMLRSRAETELQEKRTGTAKPVLERLASTPAIATYEEVLRVKAQLLEAQRNLD
jgi:hypothetical protein